MSDKALYSQVSSDLELAFDVAQELGASCI